MDDMQTRLMRAEWRIDALEDGYRAQTDRITDLSTRMDTHHKEVMAAIGSLKDDRAKAQGAAEARLLDAQVRQNRLRWLSFGLAAIGTLVALGWIGEAKALPADAVQHDAPIPVQYHTRLVP